jgi:hypothetical protein
MHLRILLIVVAIVFAILVSFPRVTLAIFIPFPLLLILL